MENPVVKTERLLKDLLDSESDIHDETILDAIAYRKKELYDELKAQKQNIEYRQELLTILMEECGEVIQAASKCIRFGYTDDNLKRLEKELGDLQCMIDLAQESDLVSFTGMDEASANKVEKLKLYSSLISD